MPGNSCYRKNNLKHQGIAQRSQGSGATDETKKETQEFVDKNIKQGSMVNTDGSPSFRDLKNIDLDYQVVGGDQEVIDRWLPWVHKFISNAKGWVI